MSTYFNIQCFTKFAQSIGCINVFLTTQCPQTSHTYNFINSNSAVTRVIAKKCYLLVVLVVLTIIQLFHFQY